MTSKRTLLALLCIFFGAVLLVGPTFGFSTIAADRGIGVETAADETAFLGINVVYDGTQVGDRGNTPDEITVAELTNNLNTDFTGIEATVTQTGDDSLPDDTLRIDNRYTLLSGLEPGETKPINLECGNVEEQGTSDVVVLITEVDASSIMIQDKPITIENVQYDCRDDGDEQETEPGDIEFVDLTVEVSTDNQGRPDIVTFAYDLTEPADIVFETNLEGDNPERVENVEEGIFTKDPGAGGQQEFSVEVGADIDGGEVCGTVIDVEEADEEVAVCKSDT